LAVSEVRKLSRYARLVELVELRAEHDARTGRPPEPRAAVNESMRRLYDRVDRALLEESPWLALGDRPTQTQHEDLLVRYSLFYGATKAAGHGETPDELVRRWRGV
jgi:hypothetical protein